MFLGASEVITGFKLEAKMFTYTTLQGQIIPLGGCSVVPRNIPLAGNSNWNLRALELLYWHQVL